MNNFKDKKILLVCAETYSWPMHYIAKELRGNCENISAIFIQPSEAYFQSSYYKKFTSLNKDINIYEMSCIVEEYLNKHKNAKDNIDMGYIRNIDSSYSRFSSINEQLITEMMLLPYYHDRFFYKPIDYNRILLYVQIFYKKIENLIALNKPEIILDADIGFFGRTVLLEVAYKNNIPYVSIDYSRIGNYVLPTLSLTKEKNYHLKKLFNDNLRDTSLSSNKLLTEELIKTKKYIGEVPVMWKHIYQERKFSILKMIYLACKNTVTFFRHTSLKSFLLSTFQRINSPICSDSLSSLRFMYTYHIRRIYLEYSNIFETVDLKKINYIYIPLHEIPESSTVVLAPYHINEIFTIESISKSIRPDQYVVVKEHWSMVGYRPISFYRKIKQLPNVILINPVQYALPYDYIRYSDLVVTISGSAALEASVIGVNSLIFSDVTFGFLSSVKKVTISSSLRNIIKDHMKHKMKDQELYAYLKILVEWGEKIQIKNLLISPNYKNMNNCDNKNDVEGLLTILNNGVNLHYKKQEDL